MIRQSRQKGRPKKGARKSSAWRVEPLASDHFQIGKVGSHELVVMLAAAYGRIRSLELQLAAARN